MEWGQPAWLRAELAPVCVLVVAICAEWTGHRRLTRFGDPKVLGVSVSWPLRVCAWILLAAGMAAAAAVLPLPARRAPVSGLPQVELLIDRMSIEAAPGETWNMLDDTVAILMEQAPGVRFSLAVPGNPRQVIAAPTFDAGGLRILLGKLSLAPTGGSRQGLNEALAYEAAATAAWTQPRRLVVITTAGEQELEQLPVFREKAPAVLLFVTLGGIDRPVHYGRRSEAGSWNWSLQQQEVASLLRAGSAGSGTQTGLSLIQVFALMALLLLAGERLCRLASRARPQGGFVD